MKQVILFFPDSSKLADYLLVLRTGPVETNSVQLTLKADLTSEQVTEAVVFYGAEVYPSHSWEELEGWFEHLRKKTGGHQSPAVQYCHTWL